MDQSSTRVAPYRKPLGRILVEMGALDEDQLEHMLAVQRQDGRMLGEIVLERGAVTPLALAAACARQKTEGRDRRSALRRPSTWRPLGQILIDRLKISPLQLQQALADQRLDSAFLGEILIRRGWITPAELVGALSAQLAHVSDDDKCFYVRERVGGEVRTLHNAPTFLAASDYAFEEVLADREPEQLEIVRGTGTAAEVVWCFTPAQDASPRPAALIQVFRMLMSEWAAAAQP